MIQDDLIRIVYKYLYLFVTGHQTLHIFVLIVSIEDDNIFLQCKASGVPSTRANNGGLCRPKNIEMPIKPSPFAQK